MHKTGSSSIQNTLFENRTYLLENCDLNYFSTQANHSVLNHVFGDEAGLDKMPVPSGFGSEKAFAEYKSVLKTKLKSALETNTSNYFVISGEGLSLLGDAAVQRLAAFMEPLFDQVQIYIYVRDPYSYADSAGQQQIKQGATFYSIRTSTLGQFDPNAPKDPRPLVGSVFPFYQMRIEGFQTSFGRDNVHIYEFSPDKLKDGDVVADFIYRAFGIDLSEHKIDVASDNKSLRKDAVHILEALNRADGIYPKVKSLPKQLNTMKGEKFALPDFDYAAYGGLMREDMVWLRQATQGRIDFTKLVPPDTSKCEALDASVTAQFINDLSLDVEISRIRSQVFQILWQLSQGQTQAAKNVGAVVNRSTDTRLLATFANGLKKLDYSDEALIAVNRAIILDPNDKRLLELRKRLKAP